MVLSYSVNGRHFGCVDAEEELESEEVEVIESICGPVRTDFSFQVRTLNCEELIERRQLDIMYTS